MQAYMDDERWLPIVAFPGYEVSSYGRVRSHLRKHRPKHVLRPYLNKDGYFSCALYRGRVCKELTIHQLVLTAFIGKAPKGRQCGHRDGDKLNNHVNNLYWATPQENSDDKQRHGTVLRGEHAERDVHRIRELHLQGASRGDLADSFGVTKANIRAIILRLSWRHI